MKIKYIHKIAAICSIGALGLAMFASCSDDCEPILKLNEQASLNAISSTSLVITAENCDEDFPPITWSEADYGPKSVVNYELTMTNKDNNKSIVLGTTEETALKFTNAQMNENLAKLSASPGVETNIEFSLVSKAYEALKDEAANKLECSMTCYDPNMKDITWHTAYVAVGYPNWDFSKSYMLGDIKDDGNFEGYVYFDDAAEFAIIDAQDPTKVLAEGQSVDAKGFYRINVDAEGNASHTESLKWGLIGSATSGGWDKDSEMEYDKDTRLWTIITSLVENDFKFRANNNWNYNYGAISDDKVSEISGELKAGGPNLKIPKTHAYKVILNLTEAGRYSYSYEETEVVLSSSFMTLPGSYQGWNPTGEDCYKVNSEARDFKYTGTYYFPDNTEFKFHDAGTWMGVVGDIKWNEEKTEAEFVIGDGGNIKIETGGYYRVSADTKKMVAKMNLTGWELIGDATPGGWDKGTLMTYNAKDKTWSITLDLEEGSFKFRWDASWEKNRGGDLDALTQDGKNIEIEAGNYTITYKPEEERATVVKN